LIELFAARRFCEATVGCEDLVIVHTADATLVMPRAEAERVKDLVARIPGTWR
jgi:mannose-1-phosphate guanylyltransferase